MKFVVPVMPRSFEEATNLDLAAYEGADIIEWRADVLPKEAITQVAPVIFEKFAGYEIIFTLRTTNQEGGCCLTSRDYVEVIKQIQALCQPDYIDFEYYSHQDVFEELLDYPNLILSHYDFEKVPENIMEIYSTLTALSPRVVKVAFTPRNEQEVLDMMNFNRGFKTLNPEQTYMSVALGVLGQVTRLFGDLFGSCWTVVSVGQATSSGQLRLADARQILDILATYENEGEQYDN